VALLAPWGLLRTRLAATGRPDDPCGISHVLHARYAMINGVSYTETYAPPLRVALDPSHTPWRVGAEAGRVPRQYNIRILENWMVYN